MEPGIIRKLDEEVVNRIAAGEIIQRPANAIKEMIENSLDAKSTFIQVTLKMGGLKFLQVEDNGTGIRKEDLEILCERFTTSKLEKFEDLTQIATYGFRGEALSSISHISHLTIQTKTHNEICAYKASYENGKLRGAPKPCAGNQGTVITVEDLFYNVPQRRQMFKSPNEEFQKVSNVISKYAIHNCKVRFSLRKFGENPSVKTPHNSSVVENIGIIYGSQISKELIQIGMKDDLYKFKMNGYITNLNYSSRKGTMLLFINHRLVESNALKSAVDEVYSTFLAKGAFPFIYISIELDPTMVDVNVHPTKHEVKFLYEQEIIDRIKEHVETKLLGSNATRTFFKQTKLLNSTAFSTDKQILQESVPSSSSNSSSQRVYAKDLIRTDAKEQKLDKFFSFPNNNRDSIQAEDHTQMKFLEEFKSPEKMKIVRKKQTKLTSILEMRKKIERAASSQIRNILKDMVFVGVVDKNYAAFQFETKLYLCNTEVFSRELFYQSLIYNFENFERFSLKNVLSIRELVLIALDCKESGWSEEDGPKDVLADRVVEILTEKAAIMNEYFGLSILKEGFLESLPVLLKGHKPSMCFLPIYILRLATEVEWETEEECFETFCRETADFYASVGESEVDSKNHHWIVEHVIYPALRNKLIPNIKLKKYLFELAHLPNLYKVFERC